jgi:hypothetical protein
MENQLPPPPPYETVAFSISSSITSSIINSSSSILNTVSPPPPSPSVCCPICLDDFIDGDEVIVGCDVEQHIHHTECFRKMVDKLKICCAQCRTEGKFEYTRKFRVCGYLRENNEDNINGGYILLCVGVWCFPCILLGCLGLSPYYCCTSLEKRDCKSDYKISKFKK